MTTDQWIESNTGYCSALNARITRRQCDQNREKCFSCDGCAGLQETDDMGKSKKTVAACKECGRVMEIAGRGKCGKCYHHEMKDQLKAAKITRAEKALPEPQHDEPTPSNDEPILKTVSELMHTPSCLFGGLLPVENEANLMTIELDFAGDGDLYRAIVESGTDQDDIIDLLRLVFTGKYELRKVIA